MRSGPKMAQAGEGTTSFDFSSPIIMETMQRERVEGFVRPVGGVVGDGPFEFIIPESDDGFLHLDSINLFAKCKITKPGGGDLEDPEDVVAPINNFGIALWANTEVSLNDYVVSQRSVPFSNYKGHLETILSYDKSMKDAHLPCQLFYPDSPGLYNKTEIVGFNVNEGYKQRRALANRSKVFETISPIKADFLRTMNHLAPGNKLSIRLDKAKNSFLLLAKEQEGGDLPDYEVKILDLKLYYNRIRLAENIKPIARERYPIETTEMKIFPLSSGLLQANIDVIGSGRIPKTVIVAQVLTEAMKGSYKENPFFFHHFFLNSISLKVNDKRIPSDPLTPSFASGEISQAIRAYQHLHSNIGIYRQNKGTCLSPACFMNGMTVFPFDLSPDLCNGYHVHESQRGSLSIEISWQHELTSPITLLVYCSYDDIIVKQEEDRKLFEIEEI